MDVTGGSKDMTHTLLIDAAGGSRTLPPACQAGARIAHVHLVVFGVVDQRNQTPQIGMPRG